LLHEELDDLRGAEWRHRNGDRVSRRHQLNVGREQNTSEWPTRAQISEIVGPARDRGAVGFVVDDESRGVFGDVVGYRPRRRRNVRMAHEREHSA
jgi:hypothetical protein